MFTLTIITVMMLLCVALPPRPPLPSTNPFAKFSRPIPPGKYLEECKREISFRDKDHFTDEDIKMLQDSLNTYGPPQSLTSANLPGPEIVIGQNLSAADGNRLIKDNSGNYILKIRKSTDEFSYNTRYEVGTMERINRRVTLVVKGQFSEQFPRKSGGYYIRTFGYISNHTGYKRFWSDLSKVVALKMRRRLVNRHGPDSIRFYDCADASTGLGSFGTSGLG